MTTSKEPTKVSESGQLKALAHPLRAKAYEVLSVRGPATVSMLSEWMGEPVGLLAYHLGQLAKYDFIEEVPELAKDKRERWWRAGPGITWSDADFLDRPADHATANTVYAQHVGAQLEHIKAFRANLPAWGKEWAESSNAGQYWLELTPAETEEYALEIRAIMQKWKDRTVPDDGQKREHVITFFYAFPGDI